MKLEARLFFRFGNNPDICGYLDIDYPKSRLF